MKLTAHERSTSKKGEVNRVRHAKDVPAVVYGFDHSSLPVFIKGEDMDAFLRKVPKDKVTTTAVELEVKGKTYKALIKELQHHKTSYRLMHVDFFIVPSEKKIKVEVPITLHGTMECVGVKLGGIIRRTIRYLPIECLLKDLPGEFILNVKEMSLGDSRRLSDIQIPAGVKPLAKMNEVVVTVGKR